MMKLIVPVSLLALAATQALAANDIAGVQTGVPLSTVRAAVEKINPSYQVSDIKYTDGKVGGFDAREGKDGKIVDQFVAMQNEEGVVWFIARAQALEQGSRIATEVLQSSLKDKYGVHTELQSYNDGRVTTWQFDRQGKIYQGTPGRGPCNARNVGNNRSEVSETLIQVPENFAPQCGTEIKAFVKVGEGLVPAFAVQIVNSKLMYDELTGKAAAEEKERKRKEDEKNKKIEAEKAKNVKPKL